MGVEKGRSTKKDLKIGICGEHGGDPQSIAFCHEVGLDYVSLLAVPGPGRPSGRRAGRHRHDGDARQVAALRKDVRLVVVKWADASQQVLKEVGQAVAVVVEAV